MPITPLHFGPALAVRELVGQKRFGIWAFATTQILFDVEPVIRIVFDLDGTLHQTTHNPLFGAIYVLIAIVACWTWEKWSGIFGAIFGSVTHLWLDAIYHSDVAAAMAIWGFPVIAMFNVEMVCLIGFCFWLLFLGVRYSINLLRAKRQGNE